jgi:hypothetical protein
MSALIFVIQPEVVYLACDTLALDSDTREPRSFTTKLYYLPHLGLVMCGTGLAKVILDWFVTMNSALLAKDMDHVDEFASALLRGLYSKAIDEFGQGAGSVTIYHFGYSGQFGQMIARIYRSERDFVPEHLTTGIGVKPAPKSGVCQPISIVPDDFISIISELAQEDAARPKSERVGVGGEVLFCELRHHQTFLTTATRFEDWQETYGRMCMRLP